MKRLLALFTLIPLAVASFTSCQETKTVDDKANWESRNIEFMQGIISQYEASHANVTDAQEGQMFRLLSYQLDSTKAWDPLSSYVYCKVRERGAGTTSPQFTDSVRINYRVRLMPSDDYPEGQIIDQSYKTAKLDPKVNIPYSFRVSGLVDGVTTALMHMHTGDTWTLYIPYQLGYGSDKYNSVPACSALIFELNLVEFARTGDPLSPR